MREEERVSVDGRVRVVWVEESWAFPLVLSVKSNGGEHVDCWARREWMANPLTRLANSPSFLFTCLWFSLLPKVMLFFAFCIGCSLVLCNLYFMKSLFPTSSFSKSKWKKRTVVKLKNGYKKFKNWGCMCFSLLFDRLVRIECLFVLIGIIYVFSFVPRFLLLKTSCFLFKRVVGKKASVKDDV